MTDKHILCPICAKRIMGYPDTMDPTINSLYQAGYIKRRRVPGIQRVRSMETGQILHEQASMKILCDSCNTELFDGWSAYAWSAWPMGDKRECWEDEFLSNIEVVKEQLRE